MKKIIRLLILSCLIATCLIPNVAFAAVGTSQPEWQDVTLTDEEFDAILSLNPNNEITPYATGLITGKNIAISKSGTVLTIIGITEGSSEVKKCGFSEVTIQRRKNASSSWSDYQTYKDLCRESRSYQLTKKVTVPSGYQYRVTCTHYAKKNIFSTQKIDNTSNIVTV